MDHRVGGRKASQYHPAIGAVILARVEAGETVRQVAADDWMPSRSTIQHWVRMHRNFGDAWRALRADQGAWIIERRMLRAEARAWRAAHEVRLGMRRRRGVGSGGRSTYTQAVADLFCARVAAGETMRAICTGAAMPDRKTICTWLKRRPEFREAYVAAKADQRMGLERAIVAVIEEGLWPMCPLACAQVDALLGRIGQLTAKTYRALPRVWD